MNRAHVPTTLLVLGVVLVMLIVYHLAFGRRKHRPAPAGGGYYR